MDIWMAAEQAYKNGYTKGYEDGKKDAREIILCINCINGESVKYPSGKIWCSTMCRYMNKESFCSEAEPKIN